MQAIRAPPLRNGNLAQLMERLFLIDQSVTKIVHQLEVVNFENCQGQSLNLGWRQPTIIVLMGIDRSRSLVSYDGPYHEQ